jgi:hypothetical protein
MPLQVAQKKGELEVRRSAVQRQLDEALPAVEEAREAVNGIKRQQLDEVGTFEGGHHICNNHVSPYPFLFAGDLQLANILIADC